jgi:fructose-1,6-bisphosphatase II
MNQEIPSNLGLDMVRVTETVALTAGRYMGLRQAAQADRAATDTMVENLNKLNIKGVVVLGEEERLGVHTLLDSGNMVGTGEGPDLDLVFDPIDGTQLLAVGHSDSISVVGMAPRGTMASLFPAVYMDKIVVDREAAAFLAPECLDAPAAWTLAHVARGKKKRVRDLVVFVLNRPRHKHLIEEICTAGARVILRSQGDIAGAIMAASPEIDVDLLMGIGGATEGVIASCGIKSLGGAMLGRLTPQSDHERTAVLEAGLDTSQILTCEELVAGEEIFFVATGITNGAIMSGVRYQGDRARTESIILRCKTKTRRVVITEHLIDFEDLKQSKTHYSS